MRYEFKNLLIGTLIGIASLIWTRLETAYFLHRDGWHRFPIHLDERVCDAAGVLGMLFSMLFLIKAWPKR